MKHKSTERGQALVIIAFAAVGLIAFTALAVDGGRIFSERRQTQFAADSAAMAAALALCRGNDASNAGLTMANTNGYNDNSTNNWVDVNIPPTSGTYIGLSGYVEVTISSHIPTTFAKLVYDGPLKAFGRSVARCGTNTAFIPYDEDSFRGVWAGAGSGCGPGDYILWGGNEYTIYGGAHSNRDLRITGNLLDINGPTTVVGDLEISGNDNALELTTVGALNDNGTNNTFSPLTVSAPPSLTNPFAAEYTFSDFDSGGEIYTAAATVNRIVITNQKMDMGWLKTSCTMDGVQCYDDSAKVLQDGIYVTTYTGPDAVTIGDGNIHGDGGAADFANVTFVTNDGGIQFSGSDNKFNPYLGNEDAADSTSFLQGRHGILAATWGQGADQCTDTILSTGGSNVQLGGLLYAPNGQIEFSGQNETIQGCTIAYTVSLNGSDSTITCDDTWFPPADLFIALIE